MKIFMSSGHGLYVRGASGSPVPPELDEVDSARMLVERTAELINSMDGHSCTTFHDNTSRDQSTNLETIVNAHNASGPHEYDISVHFNAYNGAANGCEMLYTTSNGKTLATKMVNAVVAAGHFVNRGPKERNDLYFLNATRETACLAEICFCDHTGDSQSFTATFEAIAEALAESITGSQVGEQPPVEPEQPPQQPPDVTGDNRVVINGTKRGDVTLIVNGVMVSGHEGCEHVVDLNISIHGDAVLVVNGEEFRAKPPVEPESGIPPNQADVEATVFGGSSDKNYSAYPPYDSAGNGRLLNDTDLYVALPFRIEGERPKIRVYHGELSAEATIEDVGPWCTTNNYWDIGARPLAETCHNANQPLPEGSGPHAGTVPSNAAGIDLSPALASKIGLQGKDYVDWEFVSPGVA